jgi:outer membrane protein assembly factor BamB
MVDFGNGEVEWAEVGLSDNQTGIKATEDACQKLGLSITASWGPYGAFVSEIGGAAAPFDYSWWWGIFVWNHSQNSWESSSYGASSIELEDGDVIGWTPAWDYLDPAKPTPTPSMKFPWLQFRHDATNSGHTKNLGPRNNSVSWIFDTKTKELASSPVIAGEKIVINNWGGVFCLDLDGEILWHNMDVLGGFSPAIAYNTVFIGGKDGYLYSLNFTNGEILWSTKITSHPGISGVTSSPKVDKGKLYVGAFNFSGGAGSLFCIDAKTGSVLWEKETSSSVYFSSPTVYDDKVFVGTMGLYNSSSLKWNAPYDFYSFNAKNGELIWKYTVDGSIGSSAAIIDNKVLFTSKNGYLYCLNSETGELIWRKEIGSSVSSPAIMDDTIFVGSGELDSEGDFYALDLNGNVLWEFAPNGAVQGSPAVSGELVYFATNVKKGTVYCLNNTNGELVWEYTPWPNEYIISSPTIVEGRAYISSDNGRLYCFDGKSTTITVELNTPNDIHIGEEVIFIHNEKKNSLKVTGFSEDKIFIIIDSVEEEFEVNLNIIAIVDTDSDGKDDMTVLVSDLNSDTQTAHLTLDVYEEMEFKEDSRVFLVGIIVLVIIVILIIAGILVNLKRRR